MHIPVRLRAAAAAALAVSLGATVGHAEKTINVPADYATITEAIENSEWGDTILVGPGVYQESIILTEQKGDGLILKSARGKGETSISYGEGASVNEAVVTFQRCSNSTQLIGFTIDGRGVAKRGILTNSQSTPVLHDLVIHNADYGVAAHRDARPYIEDSTIQKCSVAGLFIQGGSADVKNVRFVEGEKFGVYVRGAIEPIRFRNVTVRDNGQVGIQAVEAELSILTAEITNNGDTGLLLQDAHVDLQNATVANHANIGVVMDACTGQVVSCNVHDNNFGLVVAITGSPLIAKCTFENNASYHVGVEGEATPTVGGSHDNANRVLGETEFVLQSSSSGEVNASYNFWDKPCAPKSIFQNTGGGKIKKKPWVSGNLLRVYGDCIESRKYNKKWKNGKLDSLGNPIGKDQDEDVSPASLEEGDDDEFVGGSGA
jgi:hypothetical protein